MSLEMFVRLFILSLILTNMVASLFANEPAKTELTAAPEVWVTSIATVTADIGGTKKHLAYAGTATGLLLRPADVVCWEGDDFAKRTTIMTHPAAVWCVQVCDDGGHVASTDYRGNLQTYEIASGKTSMYEGAFERWTQAMRFAPKSDTIVAGNEAGKLFVWEDGKVAKSIDVDKNAITDIAFSSSGDRMALSDGAGTIHLYTWPALEPNGKIKVSDSPAWCVQFNADSSALIVGSGDRKLYRCEAKDGAKAETILEGTDWITRLAVSASGAIAAGEVGGKLFVLNSDKPSGVAVAPTGTAPSGVWAVHWASPNSLLVGTRKNGVVSLAQSWTMVTSTAPADPVKEHADEPK